MNPPLGDMKDSSELSIEYNGIIGGQECLPSSEGLSQDVLTAKWPK